jgi:hypothetical protein
VSALVYQYSKVAMATTTTAAAAAIYKMMVMVMVLVTLRGVALRHSLSRVAILRRTKKGGHP